MYRRIGAVTKTPAPSPVDPDIVRQELDRILGSPTFHQVDRLRRFLHFIVQEAIAGRGDQLKEYVLGVQVFDKETAFDPRTDPIVRVQARRLRARLVRYYQERGQNDDLVIELPKGGYSPAFRKREGAAAPRRSVATALASRNTVAVLPFADHSASGDLAYFCQGVRQELIHRLATFESLRVVAWDPTNLGFSAEPLEVAARIDAAMLVSGSIRRVDDRLRTTVQLVEGTSGCYLWSEAVEGSMSNVFGAQEAVADAVLRRLRPELIDSGSALPPRRSTQNLGAHNLYLQGRYHVSQRTEESLHKAVEFFEKAIAEDAQFALAHSGLADAYGLLGHYGVLGPADVWTKAASSAAMAVMLDGNSAEARTSIAHVKGTQDWDWVGAEREYQRAITLDNRYPTAHHWYAMSCLAPMARLDEALEQMILAAALDPVSSIIARDVAMIYLFRRDFESALDQCDHTIELNPHFSAGYWTLGLIQEQRRDFDEAAAAFQRAIHLAPNSPRMHAALARTYALSGQPKAAQKILAKLKVQSKERYVSPFELASLHFVLGQTDQGFIYLTRAWDDRCFELISLRVDPRFDDLRRDRRFGAIAGQLKLD